MSAIHSSSLKRLLLFILTSSFKHNESQAYASPINGMLISKAGVTTVYHADNGRCYDGSISGSEVTCPVPVLPITLRFPVVPVAVWGESFSSNSYQGLVFSICMTMNYFVKRNQRQKELKESTSTELPPPEYCVSLPEAQNLTNDEESS
ncbi:hypothetical protein ARMSODRAFT_978842 [Armillaria solidipes]|uniref:Uncharacterized protein n=1 Tax=Armillaria solidipes TaxID=1076256 RepID=A0A2H3B7Q5_9AGAR|nr:hypothetical protein ARMSODRAFT_978842 [Armillaria solidipes]